MKFIGINVPDEPLSCMIDVMSGRAGFPNYRCEYAQILSFIEMHQRVRPHDLFKEFDRLKSMRLRRYDIISLNPIDMTYGLTKAGRDLVRFIQWFSPICELIAVIEQNKIESIEELDVTLVMSGKHYLIDNNVLNKLNALEREYENCMRTYMPTWLLNFVRSVIRFIEDHETLFKRLDERRVNIQ